MNVMHEVFEHDARSFDERKLRNDLAGKTLQELMEWTRAREEEATQCELILAHVRRGNYAALKPYLKEPRPLSRGLDAESLKELRQFTRERVLDPKESSVGWLQQTEQADTSLATEQARVDLLFGPGRIHCMIVHDENGNSGIAVVGARTAELNAAFKLDTDRDLARRGTQIGKEIIRQTIEKSVTDDRPLRNTQASATTRASKSRII